MSKTGSASLLVKLNNTCERHRLAAKKDFLPDVAHASLRLFTYYAARLLVGIPEDMRPKQTDNLSLLVDTTLRNNVEKLADEIAKKKTEKEKDIGSSNL